MHAARLVAASLACIADRYGAMPAMGDGRVERVNPPGHVVVRRSSSEELNSIADATRSLAEMLGGEFRRINARRGEGLLHRTWYVCMYTLGAIRNGAGGERSGEM